MQNNKHNDRELFESSIRALEAEIANIGAHVTIDAEARRAYSRQILTMSSELKTSARTGKITWSAAAAQANDARNVIMELIRNRSTPVGLAIAQQLKRDGKTLTELVARKTQQLHGKGVAFESLSIDKQNRVYSEIVKSAGKSNPKVTATMSRLSYAGRSLIFYLSLFQFIELQQLKTKLKLQVKKLLSQELALAAELFAELQLG